jgi:hypothetical protein
MKRSPMRRSRKPIPFRSAKRAAIADERRAFVARILSERPQCEARNYLRPIVGTLVGIDQDRVLSALRGCTWQSTEVHELLSRARGGSIVDDSIACALCHTCHAWVTTEPRLATMAGLQRSRWSA